MITAIAIDDESNALGIIREFSRSIPDLDLKETFTDPIKALQYFSEKKIQIDVVFLDIQMNRLSGMTLATHLPKDTLVILTTAYPDYALQGYDLDVTDYLLKPFSFERFQKAVNKVRLLKTRMPSAGLSDTPKIKPSNDDFIFVRADYKTIKVRINDILYIEGSGNYVTLHAGKEKIMALQNLKKFEEQLQPYEFVRVHKSFIVSFNHIASIEKGWIHIDGTDIPIGESYRDSFQQFLNQNYRHF